MPIISALYKHEDEVKELRPSEIDVDTYENHYKGRLFCTTPGCPARIVYVYYTGTTGYFRTWKHDDHHDNCLYKFDRISGRTGVSTEYVLNVEVSDERKQRALKEAFEQANLSDEELEMKKSKNKHIKSNPTTTGKSTRPQVRMVLNNGIDESELVDHGVRGPNLLKRDADALKDSDVGKPRVILGIIRSVQYTENSAVIQIGKRKNVKVKFGEAFYANSPNYLGLFHHVDRFINERTNVIFTAVGEVLKTNTTGTYEFAVYHGDEFTVQNMNLLSLAAYYSRKSLE